MTSTDMADAPPTEPPKIIVPPPTEEAQYFDLCRRIIAEGAQEETRNGTTLSVFGNMMQFDLGGGCIPFVTHKRLAWRTCLTELIWFIRGRTDVAWLAERGCHIWDANGSREFLDSRGLCDYPVGALGPVYGHQWRNWNAKWPVDAGAGAGTGTDQLAQIIAALKDPAQRTSRRLIMSAWNPEQLDQMALPPCHVMCQFNVTGGNRLSCALYQRSGDVGLGVPFNIASYSALTILLAAHCGLVPDKFVYFLGNAHIYADHVAPLKARMADAQMHPFPTMRIREVREKIDDYDVDDFIIEGYQYDPRPLKMAMVA